MSHGPDPSGAIDPGTAAAATHGSYCPKMCTFACPVTAATGRDDAVPWSFHRTVSDLAAGRREPDDTLPTALEACSGCLACRAPCLFDQDVPAQVRAGRAAAHRAGVAPPAVERAVRRVRDGRSPFATPTPDPPATPDPGSATTTVVLGCRTTGGSGRAAVRLLAAAGERPSLVVPTGCCGAALDDLGVPAEAAHRRRRLTDRLPPDGPILAADPHCLPALRRARPGARVRDLPSALAERVDDGRLALAPSEGRVAYHDPCLLARREGTVAAPRRLLAAAGLQVVEPERHGPETACSGAGLAMGLLAPSAAEATAARRARGLRATGGTVVTACAGARRRLQAAGLAVRGLAELLAGRLGGHAR